MLEEEIIGLVEAQQGHAERMAATIHSQTESIKMQAHAIHELMQVCNQLRYRIERIERIINTQD